MLLGLLSGFVGKLVVFTAAIDADLAWLPGAGRPLHRARRGLNATECMNICTEAQALATPSRVRILGRLHERPHAVNELAAAVQMEASAVSHQLRLLRHLGLVVGRREGRQVTYELYDDHVPQLLEEAIAHVELGVSGRARDAAPVSA